jgi:hypothetical protein
LYLGDEKCANNKNRGAFELQFFVVVSTIPQLLQQISYVENCVLHDNKEFSSSTQRVESLAATFLIKRLSPPSAAATTTCVLETLVSIQTRDVHHHSAHGVGTKTFTALPQASSHRRDLPEMNSLRGLEFLILGQTFSSKNSFSLATNMGRTTECTLL